MAILDFEPYRLNYLVEEEGYYDANGDYHNGEKHWECIGRCNAQQSGGYQVITLPDGSDERYSFTIWVHNTFLREFKRGEKIRLITVHGCERIELTVKGFSRHQTHCKIYA